MAMAEERALDAFWDEHARGLFGMIYLVTGDREVARGVLKDVGRALAREWPLHGDARERKRRLYALAIARLREVPGAATPEPQDRPAAQVLRAFAALSPEERLVLALREADPAADVDAAGALGVTPAEAGALAARADAGFRARYEDEP